MQEGLEVVLEGNCRKEGRKQRPVRLLHLPTVLKLHWLTFASSTHMYLICKPTLDIPYMLICYTLKRTLADVFTGIFFSPTAGMCLEYLPQSLPEMYWNSSRYVRIMSGIFATKCSTMDYKVQSTQEHSTICTREDCVRTIRGVLGRRPSPLPIPSPTAPPSSSRNPPHDDNDP